MNAHPAADLARTLVQSRWYRDVTIKLDGYHFFGCRFEGCKLWYATTDYQISECAFTAGTTIQEGKMSEAAGDGIDAWEVAPPAKEIILAPTEKVDELESYVEKVCDAICDEMDIERGVLVTDESCVSDFLMWPIQDHLAECTAIVGRVKATLGIEVGMREYIYEVAKRLQSKESL